MTQLTAPSTPLEQPEPDEIQPTVRERFPQLYRELLVVAHAALRRLPSRSIQTGDLVHDAFLKLLREESNRHLRGRSNLGSKPDHVFKACFGAACHDLLRHRWRRRTVRQRIEQELAISVPGAEPMNFDELHEALAWLRDHDSFSAQVIESRVFGGLTIAECARLFDAAPRTVVRRYGTGLAWIRQRLEGDRDRN